MQKVEFKKLFDLGYELMEFAANNNETTIWIKNTFSVPSSVISSSIVKIAGTLYEEKRWGLFFYELIEIERDIEEELNIELAGLEIDVEDFDEDEFLQHVMEQAISEMRNSEYQAALKKLSII